MSNVMKAAYLPGNSTVVLKDALIDRDTASPIKTKASTICGSDLQGAPRKGPGISI